MSDKFFFFSKSANAKPGKGANEVGDPKNYKELAKIENWRKVLSNFHVCPFKYDGYTFNSIEHAFQYKKIALANKDKAFNFTMESKTDLGLGDGEDARKNRKVVKLKDAQIAEWDKMKMDVMAEIAKQKYEQCPDAMDVLIKTNNAQLWHIVGRGEPNVRFLHLEKIRAEKAGKSSDEIDELDKEMKQMNIDEDSDEKKTKEKESVKLEEKKESKTLKAASSIFEKEYKKNQSESESERSETRSERTQADSEREPESKRSVDFESSSERTQSRRGRTVESSRTVSSRSSGAGVSENESESSRSSGAGVSEKEDESEGEGDESDGEGDQSEGEGDQSEGEGDESEKEEKKEDIGIRIISSKDERLKSKTSYLTKEQREELKKRRTDKPEIEVKVEIAPITEEVPPSSIRSERKEKKSSSDKKMEIKDIIADDNTLDSLQKNIQLKIMEKMNKESIKKNIGKLQDYEKYQVIKMVYNIIFYGVRYGSDGLSLIANKVYDEIKRK